ncbi:hypothetical protein Pint_14092 [Pistacia integerrima]|uniref:Uncharacterized protein n=1 Tax=Pistacia integerrima TaxID=434235 RepID=A0ACC0YBI7_9ROSI|nr:hypothetical protein Pint_14092 [Pistacia integerrima]
MSTLKFKPVYNNYKGSQLRSSNMWHIVVLILHLSSTWVDGVQQVPCYFIFGDSLFDIGNNNDLQTEAKANFPPYGIDFPGGATGRFTNGRNMADILAELLGFDGYIPSFASTEKGQQDVFKGLNYASGGSGILNGTSKNHLGEVISLDQQLQNHGKIVSEIMRIKGDNKSAKDHLGQCIYTIGTGSNDYINNYFLPVFYRTKNQYTSERYATVLIQQFSQPLKDLYNYGARKIAIFGIGLLGCTPAILAMDGTDEIICVDSMNLAVKQFNDKLIRLVDELNNNLPGAKFSYVNVSGISSTPIPGVTVMKTPCCEVGNLTVNNEGLTCTQFGNSCPDRAKYAFWDGVHPTQITQVFIGKRAYKAQFSLDTYPFDIHHLAQL